MSQNNSTSLFQSQQQNQQKKRPVPNHDSILESFRDLGSDMKRSVTDDLIKKSASSAFDSLFGKLPKANENRRNPFERPYPGFQKETPQPVRRPEILNPERVAAEQARVKQEIEAIRGELVMLAKAVGKLNTEIEKAVNEVPVNPGIYHANFLERLRGVIQLIRRRVENSNEWLQLSSSRKSQKSYWGKYKKHGTKFGLSADRTPSTQTG